MATDRYIATGVSGYNYERLLTAVRENNSGWGKDGGRFSFLKALFINMFHGTLRSVAKKLADAVFRGDEESLKAFAVINKDDGRLARAIMMLAYEGRGAGIAKREVRSEFITTPPTCVWSPPPWQGGESKIICDQPLSSGLGAEALSALVRHFVGGKGSSFEYRPVPFLRGGLPLYGDVFEGCDKEILGHYLARLGAATDMSKGLKFLRAEIQRAFEGEPADVSLAAVLTGRIANLDPPSRLLDEACCIGKEAAAWLWNEDILALRDLVERLFFRRIYGEAELAQNLIQRLAYGVDPDFAAANKYDIGALLWRICEASLRRDDGITMFGYLGLARIVSGGFLNIALLELSVKAAFSSVFDDPAGVSPQRLLDLKWAFYKMAEHDPALVDQAALCRGELEAANYKMPASVAVPRQPSRAAVFAGLRDHQNIIANGTLVLQCLAAEDDADIMNSLVAFADNNALPAAAPARALANRILGMAYEFGVDAVRNYDEAARRYEQGGCEADLLGMAQAGHAEALHILEQKLCHHSLE